MSLSSGVYLGSHSTKPVGAFGERRQRRLADMNRAVVEHENDRLEGRAGLWAVETVEELQMRNEVGAALGARGGDDELAPGIVERAHHRDLSGAARANPRHAWPKRGRDRDG